MMVNNKNSSHNTRQDTYLLAIISSEPDNSQQITKGEAS